MEEEVKDEHMEKVEMAFKKFDLDEDVFFCPGKNFSRYTCHQVELCLK